MDKRSLHILKQKCRLLLCFQAAFPTARCTPKIEASTDANPVSDFASMPWPRNSQPNINAETGLSNPSDETAAG